MDVKLPQDFREFLKLLNNHHVEYLLIGGYAVGYYGYPRATNDIDFWIAVHPDNAERMVTVLQKFGFNAPQLPVSLLFLSPHILQTFYGCLNFVQGILDILQRIRRRKTVMRKWDHVQTFFVNGLMEPCR